MKPHFSYSVVLLTTVLVVGFHASHPVYGATPEDSPAAVERPGVNLKLVGTAVAGEYEKSMAVVEIDGRYQVYLREGDMFDNVLIKRILYDRVIVNAGNGEESIKLRQSLSAGIRIGDESAQPLAPVQSFGPRPPEGRNFQTVYLESETASSLFSDIDEVLKKARIDHVSVYGRPTGIRISPIEAGSVFSEIGLKGGEVIREADGKAVSAPEDAVAFFQKIKGGGEFDIIVKGRRTRKIHLIVE